MFALKKGFAQHNEKKKTQNLEERGFLGSKQRATLVRCNN
jgi:hypothetical protein